MVLNHKGTAVEVPAIIPALVNACDNWSYRREHRTHNSDEDLIELIVAEANTLTVDVYDTHPFLDGNTRTTWHLRNYLLMLDGLRPLIDLADEAAYKSAWWSATAHDHTSLRDRHQRAEPPRPLSAMLCSHQAQPTQSVKPDERLDLSCKSIQGTRIEH